MLVEMYSLHGYYSFHGYETLKILSNDGYMYGRCSIDETSGIIIIIVVIVDCDY